MAYARFVRFGRLALLCLPLVGAGIVVPAAAQAPVAVPRAYPIDTQEFERRRAIAHQYYRLAGQVRASTASPLWLADGERLVLWAPRARDTSDLVLYDARTGRSETLLTGTQFKALAGAPSAVPGNLPLALAADGDILFPAGGVVRRLRLADRSVVAAAADSAEARAFEAAVSADRRRLAYVDDGNLRIGDAGGGVPFEQHGAADYGWFVGPKGWSPDGAMVIASRLDQRHVHKVPVVTYDALETVAMRPYSKAGTPLATWEHHLIDPVSRRMVRAQLPAEEGYEFVAGWRPDGREALIIRMGRDGKKLELWAVARTDGAARLVLREENRATFVTALQFMALDWQSQVTVLPGDAGFLWISDRDGWRNLYHYDYQGRLVRQITDGRRTVHSVVRAMPGGDVYFLGSEDGERPYDRLLYRTSLAGRGSERLSPADGVHDLAFSPSGRFYVDAHSSRTRPRTVDVVAAGGARREVARADVSGLQALRYTPPQAFIARAADGETVMHGAIYFPSDFDPAKRYPVIDYIYAGPWAAMMPWGYAGSVEWPGAAMARESQAMAQMGFIVVGVDGRGTPGRGKAFLDANYGKVGQIEILDQVAAIRQAAATRPYMDLDRVGIFGHSWGGYFALHAMVTEPDFFKAGYAGASGALDELAQINEPNLGLPSLNPDGYARGSNTALAGNLKGALKMMHGTSDTNATLSTTMRMADALIRAGKHFELLVMPGQPHGPIAPADLYYFDDKAMFFTRYLGGPASAAGGARAALALPERQRTATSAGRPAR